MNNSINSIKKISTGAGIILFGIFLSKLFTYIFRLIAARYGTDNYGLLTLSLTIVTFITLIASLGVDKGIYKYISYYKEKKDFHKVKGLFWGAIKYSFIFALILTFLFFYFAPQIASTFFSNMNQKKLVMIFRIMSLTIPLHILSKILMNTFKSLQKPKFEVIIKNIIESLIKLILALILYLIGIKIIGLAIVYVLASLSTVLIGSLILKKILPILFNKFKSKSVDKILLQYSIPLILMGISITILTTIDTIMLGYFYDASTVGIYNVTVPTVQLMYIFPYAFLALFLPILTSHYLKKEMHDFINVYKFVTKWLFTFLFIVFLGFLIYSKEIINLFFGPAYISGSIALIILSIGYLINFTIYPSESVLLVLNKPKLIFLNSIIISTINFILNYFFIPKFGLNGAALATSFSFILWAIILFSESYYFTKIFPFKKSLFKILISGIFCSLLFYQLKKIIPINNFLYLIIFSFLVFITYILILILIKGFEHEDKILIHSLENKLGFKFPFLNHFFNK